MSYKIYTLMHKNDKVVGLVIDTISGKILDIGEKINYKLLPVCDLETKTTCIDYKKEISNWWDKRAVPFTRKGIPAALSLLNKQSSNQLLVDNLGLSLTDHYWIKPKNEILTWEDVNLYTNDFSDIIGDFQFNENKKELLNICSQTLFLPSASLQGELKKKWIIGTDNERYLIKGNYSGNIQQSINEIFATRIHCTQDFSEHTPYKLIQLDIENGSTVGCICKNFTNLDLEFIPAIDVCNSYHKPNDINYYNHFINICEQHGLNKEYVRKFLQYQISTDFFITNTDRHLNNLGILRDSNTLEYKLMAPIFDSGNSMLWNQTYPLSNYLDVSISSFAEKEINLLKYVKDTDLIDIDKLPTTNDLYNLYKEKACLSEEKLNFITETYGNKIELFKMHLLGHDLQKEAYITRKSPKKYYVFE